jgi:hypothetical protein
MLLLVDHISKGSVLYRGCFIKYLPGESCEPIWAIAGVAATTT